MRQRFPPLWTWASALGLALSIVLVIGSSGIIDVRNGLGMNYDSFKSRLAHLKSTVEVNEGDKVVVVIGSSYTAMAVDHHPFFYQQYQQSHGGNLHVLKLYMYGCNAKLFQKLPDFFEMVDSLQPDLVCLEESLFVYNEDEGGAHSVPDWISDYSLGLNAIKQHFLPPPYIAHLHESSSFDFFWKYHDNTYEADSLDVGQSPDFQVRTYASNKKLNEWLKRYVPKDTPIACITIPKAPYVEQELVKLRGQEDYLAFQREYQKEHGIDFWIFPDTLPYVMYSGDDHLNMTGMRRYSNWLSKQIEKQFHP